jgi:tRNA modification GTPase
MLDDPENYDDQEFNEKLQKDVSGAIYELTKLIARADEGRVLTEGIQTVIIGKPNVGKSSLLNVLAGKERAIVTEIEGTTRDALEESINLGGLSLNIIDTAGIRDTEDIIERIGVDKAKEYIEKSDLIVFVVDASKEIDDSDEKIIRLIKDKKVIVLLNKTDLVSVVSTEKLRENFQNALNQETRGEIAEMKEFLHEPECPKRYGIKKGNNETNTLTANIAKKSPSPKTPLSAFDNARNIAKTEKSQELNTNIFVKNSSQRHITTLSLPIIEISAKEEQGIDVFVDILKEMFISEELVFNEEVFISNLRQKGALVEALESLNKVNESIDNELPEDFFTIDLMDAYQALGKITGETIGEDLINEIFGKFCMGK